MNSLQQFNKAFRTFTIWIQLQLIKSPRKSRKKTNSFQLFVLFFFFVKSSIQSLESYYKNTNLFFHRLAIPKSKNCLDFSLSLHSCRCNWNDLRVLLFWLFWWNLRRKFQLVRNLINFLRTQSIWNNNH